MKTDLPRLTGLDDEEHLLDDLLLGLSEAATNPSATGSVGTAATG